MADNKILQEILAFEQKLGLKRGFYNDLLENDDWSFVIKLNAVFEAACTQALTQRLLCPELLGDLAHLDFSDKRRGKVRFLRSLDAISETHAKILYALAELRNSLVHNIAQVNFSLTRHFNELDKNQLKSQCELWGYGVTDTFLSNGKQVSRKEFVKSQPKRAIWMTCFEILACLHLEFELAEVRNAERDMDGYKRILQRIELPDITLKGLLFADNEKRQN